MIHGILFLSFHLLYGKVSSIFKQRLPSFSKVTSHLCLSPNWVANLSYFVKLSHQIWECNSRDLWCVVPSVCLSSWPSPLYQQLTSTLLLWHSLSCLKLKSLGFPSAHTAAGPKSAACCWHTLLKGWPTNIPGALLSWTAMVLLCRRFSVHILPSVRYFLQFILKCSTRHVVNLGLTLWCCVKVTYTDIEIHKRLMVCQHFSPCLCHVMVDLSSLMDVCSRCSFPQERAKPNGISKNINENKASQGSAGGVELQMRWGEGCRGTHSSPEMRWNDARGWTVSTLRKCCLRTVILKQMLGLSVCTYVRDKQTNTEHDCWAMCTHFHQVQRG